MKFTTESIVLNFDSIVIAKRIFLLYNMTESKE
jgi:hypothetical protein